MFAEKAYLSGADELASLKASFMRYDPEGHGYIRSRDVESALAELGRDPSAAVAILREFDPEGEGPVDFEQFIRIAAATLRELPQFAAKHEHAAVSVVSCISTAE